MKIQERYPENAKETGTLIELYEMMRGKIISESILKPDTNFKIIDLNSSNSGNMKKQQMDKMAIENATAQELDIITKNMLANPCI